LDLQLPVQSVPITRVVSLKSAHEEVYLIQLYVKNCFSPGTQFFPTKKSDRHNINEMLLKVALINITLTLTLREDQDFELTTLVVIGTDCTGSCKSNHHAIMTMTAPLFSQVITRMITLVCVDLYLTKENIPKFQKFILMTVKFIVS
jgi:hypothetical protein